MPTQSTATTTALPRQEPLRPTRGEIAGILAFYFFFSFLYHVVIWYNGRGLVRDGPWGWLSLDHFWWSSGMQYLFCLAGSIFIWFVGIYCLRKRRQWLQMLAVFLLIPIVAYGLRTIRYAITDYLDHGRLRDEGSIWDIYIPCLFLLFQFGCYFAYTNFRENERKLKLEGELRQAALKSELAAIKAQLNPHFLHNVFNTISASVPPEQEQTRHLVSQLADLFRYQLKASKLEVVALGDELNFVKNYLALEKSRFEERLEVAIEVDPALYHRKVPPMILQPIVENSIRHGLSPLIEGGKITISIFEDGEKLRFSVVDTGVGVKDKSVIFGRGIGLTNTRLRLQKMYDTQLELLDHQPRGLEVKFTL